MDGTARDSVDVSHTLPATAAPNQRAKKVGPEPLQTNGGRREGLARQAPPPAGRGRFRGPAWRSPGGWARSLRALQVSEPGGRLARGENAAGAPRTEPLGPRERVRSGM